MAQAEDVNSIKRRSRRRLVGAIALVLAAVIVLPMVFDTEPRDAPPPVSVRIPAEDDSGFTPKVTPKAGAQVVEQPKAVPRPTLPAAPDVKAPAVPDVKAPAAPVAEAPAAPAAKAPEKPAAPSPAEQARAEAALADAEQFFIQVGAFADPASVIEKLKAAGLPFYTEPLAVKGGQVLRVRVGPFGGRGAAEKALEQLKGLGFKPGSIAAKS